MTTYALYSGWKSDSEAKGKEQYRKSNLVMVGILCGSILAAALMEVLLRVFGDRGSKGVSAEDGNGEGIVDGAAKREAEQRGLEGLAFWKRRGRK